MFGVLEAMNSDSGIPLKKLLVDGGMTANDFLMQTQADVLGIEIGKLYVYQVLDAMNSDSGIPLKKLLVDGGMTTNDFLMQTQADVLGIEIGKLYFWCFW